MTAPADPAASPPLRSDRDKTAPRDPLLLPIPLQSLRRVRVSRDRTRAGGGALAEESRLASQLSESAPLQLTTMSSPSC